MYIVRDRVTHTSAEDARFLLETINVLWDRVDQRDAFNMDTERRDYFDAIEAARAVFQRIIDGG